MKTPKTVRTTVPLSALVLRLDLYAHRDRSAYERRNLGPLMEHIRNAGGLITPPHVLGKEELYEAVTGNRRITCLQLLAADGVDGFGKDMEVEVDVLQCSEREALLWSVGDNELHLKLTPGERIRVTKRFYDTGVPIESAALALGVNQKTIERDIAIARHDWLLTHVEQNHIGYTDAAELIATAPEDKVGELKIQFEEWVERTQRLIDKEVAEAEAVGKKLTKSRLSVKGRYDDDVGCRLILKLHGKEIPEPEAQELVVGGVDPETEQLRLKSLVLNVWRDPLNHLVMAVGSMSQLTKILTAVVEERARYESEKGPRAVLKSDKKYDEDLLAKLKVEHLLQRKVGGEASVAPVIDGGASKPPAGVQ